MLTSEYWDGRPSNSSCSSSGRIVISDWFILGIFIEALNYDGQ